LKRNVIEKLCIKHLILKLNEVDKLKMFSIDENKKKEFEIFKRRVSSKDYAIL
jgi:hypothetical protein